VVHLRPGGKFSNALITSPITDDILVVVRYRLLRDTVGSWC
jgi:hypothetical protein